MKLTEATDFDLSAWGCNCAAHSRRRFGTALLGLGAATAWPAWAREGVEVGKPSIASKLVSPEQIEKMAAQQYLALRNDAKEKRMLLPNAHPQVQRLRFIGQRLIPHTFEWNPRARDWSWEVSLLASNQINAFCMPGGKIAFFTGILERLQLSDDEVAMIMGHEMAHALREHAREQMGKSMATTGAIELGAALFGLGNTGRMLAESGKKLLSLRFGREDETEADLVGMELAARAGYDPAAGISLWQKMATANKGAPPQFLSTHPSGPTRIKDIQASLPKVEPLYARASRPERTFGPPPPPRPQTE